MFVYVSIEWSNHARLFILYLYIAAAAAAIAAALN